MLLLGLLFGFGNAFFDSLGFVVQKKGHLEAAEQKKYFLTHYTWILGQASTILAVPFLIAALSLSSQTALSFIPALAILLITIWSRLILKVKLTFYDLVALLFLIPGIILIILFSSVEKIEIYSWEIGSYLFSLQTIIFVIIEFGLLISLGYFVYKILKKFGDDKEASLEENPNSAENDSIILDSPTAPSRSMMLPLFYLPYFAAFTG